MGNSDMVVCRCEDVTLSEVLAAIRDGARAINDIKRLTRAGMGICQGCICEELLARILRAECGNDPAGNDLFSIRPPLSPLRVIDILHAKTL